jgi:hypothetical protein
MIVKLEIKMLYAETRVKTQKKSKILKFQFLTATAGHPKNNDPNKNKTQKYFGE